MDKLDKARAVEILMIEDNPGDVRLAEEALKEGHLWSHISVARDGEEGMELLRKAERHAGVLLPDLVLLDLNLPRKDGREVLAEIKSDENLKSIPVVVLTTSKAEEDIVRTYKLHANCYITKPVDFQQFASVVKSIEDFWFTIVRLPAKI